MRCRCCRPRFPLSHCSRRGGLGPDEAADEVGLAQAGEPAGLSLAAELRGELRTLRWARNRRRDDYAADTQRIAERPESSASQRLSTLLLV